MDRLTLAGRVLWPEGNLSAGEVIIEDGLIASVRPIDTRDKQVIAPGLIDLQVNGAFGCDFSAQPETISQVAAHLPRTGVTAFLPTIITSPLNIYRRAFEVLSSMPADAAHARVLGLHLEGPYLSPQRAGAHNPAHLRARADPLGDGLVNAYVRLMTLAPELEHAQQAIRDLRAHDVVVSIGHSAASYAQASAALDAGASWGTHLFNAMTPLHHREPGVIGALLADPRAAVGLIADGVHLHPSLFTWLIKALGTARITLVTDAMAAAGMPAGDYHLGDRRVTVDEHSARLENGTLAGSILTLDQAVRNLVAWGACSLADALTMASATPARLLGLSNLGRIEAGCAADLIVLDDKLRVTQTIVHGRPVPFEAA